MRRAREYIEKGLSLLFPQNLYCICCGNIIDDSRTYSLCDYCMDHIRWNADDPYERGDMLFMKCMEYGPLERSIIFDLKYNRKRYFARNIAEIMRDRFEISGLSADLIIPVPMNKSKQRMRGFNQAALIGRHMSKIMGIECIEDALVRTRNTRPMRGLGPEERAENIAGSIDFNEFYGTIAKGKTVLLIDDFYTTGSTAQECRRALSKSEPKNIIFLAFAAR